MSDSIATWLELSAERWRVWEQTGADLFEGEPWSAGTVSATTNLGLILEGAVGDFETALHEQEDIVAARETLDEINTMLRFLHVGSMN